MGLPGRAAGAARGDMEEEGKKGKKVSAHRRVLPPGRGVGWGSPGVGGRRSGQGQWSGGPAAPGGSAAPFRCVCVGVPFTACSRPAPDGLSGGPPSPRDGLGPQRKWAQRGARRWPELELGPLNCAVTGEAFTAHLALFLDVQ